MNLSATRWAPSAGRILGLVLAAALATGCPDVREFQPDLPYGGRAQAIAVSPATPDTLLVAAETGGLFRSSDAGEHWSHLDGFPNYLPNDVEYAPGDANVVIATARVDFRAASPGGIFRSTDGGETWTQPSTSTPAPGNLCPDRVNAWSVSFAPDSQDVYAGTDCGLAHSADLGATWTHTTFVTATAPNADKTQDRVGSVLALANGRLYAISWGNVWSRSSSGAAWAIANSPRPHPNWPHALAVAPFDPNHVFVVSKNHELFLSTDGGINWVLQRAGDGNRWAFVRTALTQSGQTGQYDVYFGGGVRLRRSTYTHGTPPTAGTWTQLGLAHADPADLAIGADGRTPILLGGDGGVEKTADGGASWKLVGGNGQGYHALQITEVTGQLVSGSAPHTDLYIGTQDNRIHASADAGRSWPWRICCEGFYLRTPRSSVDHAGTKVSGVKCGGCTNFQADAHLQNTVAFPNPANHAGNPFLIAPGVYIELADDNSVNPPVWKLMLTEDDGGTWQDRGAISQTLKGRPLIAGAASKPVVYWAVVRPGLTYQGYGRLGLVRISNVRGMGSIVIEDADQNGLGSLGTFPTMFAWYRVFGVNPGWPDHLIAQDLETGEAKFTLDGGKNWAVDAPLTDRLLDGGAFVPNRGGFVFMHTVEFDPDNVCHVLVGTAQNGILRSVSGGLSWEKVEDTERISNLSSIFFADGEDLFVSSYGRGLWKVRVDRPAPPKRVDPEVCRPTPIFWPPKIKPPRAPTFLDRRDVRIPFVDPGGPGDPPPCLVCTYLIVKHGHLTDASFERDALTGIAISGGTVVAWDSQGRETELDLPVRLRWSPSTFAGHPQLQRLKEEKLRVRGLVLEGRQLRFLITSDAELPVEVPYAPVLRLDSASMADGYPLAAAGETLLIRGWGFEPPPKGVARLALYVDGEQVPGQPAVDAQGRLSSKLAADFDLGEHVLEVAQRSHTKVLTARATFQVIVEEDFEEDRRHP